MNILNNTITIPNHFLVSGEEVVYSHAGAGSTQAIGIASTSFVSVGSTDKIPATVYVVKVSSNLIKLASSAQNALKSIPEVLNFTSVGIGSSHTFNSTNQNALKRVAKSLNSQSECLVCRSQPKMRCNKFIDQSSLR